MGQVIAGSKQPAYIQEKALQQATKKFEETPLKEEIEVQGMTFQRSLKDVSPETATILEDIKANPNKYDLTYSNGVIVKAQAKPKTYTTKEKHDWKKSKNLERWGEEYIPEIWNFTKKGLLESYQKFKTEATVKKTRTYRKIKQEIQKNFDTGIVSGGWKQNIGTIFKNETPSQSKFDVINGQLKVIEESGKIRNVSRNEFDSGIKYLNDINQIQKQSRTDKNTIDKINNKLSKGKSLTNKEFLDLANIKLKYGENVKEVSNLARQQINNKNLIIPTTPNTNIWTGNTGKTTDQDIKTFTNDKGQIIGYTDTLGQQSVSVTKKDHFFKQSDINNLKSERQSQRETFEKQNKKSESEQFFENQINTIKNFWNDITEKDSQKYIKEAFFEPFIPLVNRGKKLTTKGKGTIKNIKQESNKLNENFIQAIKTTSSSFFDPFRPLVQSIDKNKKVPFEPIYSADRISQPTKQIMTDLFSPFVMKYGTGKDTVTFYDAIKEGDKYFSSLKIVPTIDGKYTNPLERLQNKDKEIKFVTVPQSLAKTTAREKDKTRSFVKSAFAESKKEGNKDTNEIIRALFEPFPNNKAKEQFLNDPAKKIRNTGLVIKGTAKGLYSHGVLDLLQTASEKPVSTPFVLGGVAVGGIVAESIIPTSGKVVTGAIGTYFSVSDWLSRPTSTDKALAFGGDVALAGLSWGASGFIQEGIVKLSPDYRKVETDIFGRKKIPEVETKKGKSINIDLVPEGFKGIEFDIKPKKLLKQYPLNLKDTPKVPKVSPIMEDIFSILKEDEIKFSTDSSVSGSIMQNTFSKKPRKIGDLDIVSDAPELIAMKIKEQKGDLVKIKKATITDSPFGNFDIYKVAEVQKDGSYKHIADIDPLKFSEEGFAIKYKPVDIEGVPFTDIRSRYIAKVQQAGRGKRTDKVLKDINILSDGKIDFTGQSSRGGFGFTFKEQSAFVGKTGDLATAQQGLFPNRFFNRFKDNIEIYKPDLENPISIEGSFFASPFDLKTGNPQLRASRLGLSKEASLSDLSEGIQFRKGQSQAIIFEDHKIADIPFNLKKLYKNALKQGEGSKAYQNFFKEYEKFQMKPTGEFKNFGYMGGEAELTLSPKEIIKGKGKIGTTLIDKTKVNIIQAEVVKASPELAKLQTKEIKGLTLPEVKRLNQLRKIESGGLSSPKKSKSYIELEKGIGIIPSIKETKIKPLKYKSSPKLQIKQISFAINKSSSSKISKISKISYISKGSKSSPISKIYKSSPISTGSKASPISKISKASSLSKGSKPSYISRISKASSPIKSYSNRSHSIKEETIKSPEPRSPFYGRFNLSRKNKEGSGFIVEIRKKGVFQKVNVKPLIETEATALGMEKVGTSASATFRLRKAFGEIGSFKSNIAMPKDFYRKQDLFIEKRGRRIKSAGELREITFKGIQANRGKNKLFNNNNKIKNIWGL